MSRLVKKAQTATLPCFWSKPVAKPKCIWLIREKTSLPILSSKNMLYVCAKTWLKFWLPISFQKGKTAKKTMRPCLTNWPLPHKAKKALTSIKILLSAGRPPGQTEWKRPSTDWDKNRDMKMHQNRLLKELRQPTRNLLRNMVRLILCLKAA